ncbi:hypothetical protein BGZ50_007590, partial [Haplosporangium sp. Z 11]
IWPEFDPDGHGVMAENMEKILRRVEQEQGASLLVQSSWEQLRDYTARVGSTIVRQKDLGDLLTLLQQTAFVEQTPCQDNEVEERRPDDQDRNDVHQIEQAPSKTQIHRRHHSPAPYRPRMPSARKISLSESNEFAPRYFRPTRESEDNEFEGSEHQTPTFGHNSRETRSGTSSSISSPIQAEGDIWRNHHNSMSIREQSQTEFEGYGLDAEYASPEIHIESAKFTYWALQKKLRDKELEYEARVNEHSKEDTQNQQQISDLRRELINMRREISDLRSTELLKTSQIAELEKQIEKIDRTSSTQKNSAATWKKQRDELQDENSRMQESLRLKEEALNQAIIRLTSMEADARRITADQETVAQLREQLAAQITKNQAMAWELQLEKNEKLRLEESLKNEYESLGGGHGASDSIDLGNTTDNIQGRTLMSELANADSQFGHGVELSNGNTDGNNQPSTEPTGTRDPAHDVARRLLEESKTFNNKLKRSSIRDLNQRFKDSGYEAVLQKQTRESVSYIPAPTVSQDADTDLSATAVILKQKVDDVDCELPPELQTLENKEALLDRELESQAEIIEGLFKAKVAKTERARRRKLQSSRILSQNEVVEMLNPGANMNTRALNRRENKNVIANVTLVSMYTIIVYLFGMITSVFFVENGHMPGVLNTRYLAFDALQDAAVNDGPGRFKVIEILVYWLQNLVWQGDAGYVAT